MVRTVRRIPPTSRASLSLRVNPKRASMLLICSPFGLRVGSWLFLVCMAGLLDTVLAYSPISPPYEELPEWATNKLFWCSADAPMTAHLAGNPAYVKSARVLLDHFTLAERAILEVLRRKKKLAADDPFKPCNYGRVGWIRSTDAYFMQRRWAQPDSSCVTDMHGTQTKRGERPKYSVDELYDAVYTRGSIMKSEAQALADKTIGNFTDPDFNFNSVFTRLNQRCVIHPTGAVRVNGDWNLITPVQSLNSFQTVPKGKRFIIAEHHKVEKDGRLGSPLVMMMDRIAKESQNETNFERRLETGTTSISSGGKQVLPSYFAPIFPEENKAVVDALRTSDFYLQQAEDALALSSVAILVLPLFLNLVPIALISDVSTTTTFVYTVLSDVVTVIPLAIKGFELIFIGTRKVRTVVLRMSSATSGDKAETAVADMWAAECGVEGRALTYGRVFVGLSIVSMIVGVAAEFAAKRYVRRKQAQQLAIAAEQIPLFKQSGKTPHKTSSSSSTSSQVANTSSKNRAQQRRVGWSY